MMTFEILYWLALGSMILGRGDFAALYERVRRQPAKTKRWDRETVQKACARVDRVCTLVPMPASCLLRSTVLTTVLRRRGVPAELVLGATRLPFKGHAWVELRGEVLNDKPYMHDMYVIWDRI